MTQVKHKRIIGGAYEISTDGAVHSCGSNWRGYGRRVMHQQLNPYGYPSVRLTQDGKRKRLCVHVLVAKAFLPPKANPALQVRHLDGDKTNNVSSNLCWGTAKENAEDRKRHGRTSSGPKHSMAIIAGFAKRREENHNV